MLIPASTTMCDPVGRSPATDRILATEMRIGRGEKPPFVLSVGKLPEHEVERIRQHFITRGLFATLQSRKPPRRGKHHRNAILVISQPHR